MRQDDELVLLKERAQAVQTITTEVADFRAACLYAVDVTLRQGGSCIAAPGVSGKDLSHLKAACKAGGLRLLTKNLRENIEQISTGLTIADWGIAETATLVMDSTSEDFRIATMLCETHVAVLPRSRIVPDVMSIEDKLVSALKTAPKYLAFISGASRTADIERVLTIGVHGPQELHLLIMEGDGK
jgi:L-lactate dehydrogenase complex protein LldG